MTDVSLTQFGETELRMLRALEAAIVAKDAEREARIRTALKVLREVYAPTNLDGIERKEK